MAAYNSYSLVPMWKYISLFIFLLHQAASETFLHITDIHLDLNYKKQASVVYSCHRKDVPGPSGDFGIRDVRCDGPERLLEATVLAIRAMKPQPTFLLWGGDSVRTAQDPSLPLLLPEHSRTMVAVADALSDMAVNIPIVPVIGPADVFPIGQLAVGPNQQLQNLSTVWSELLPKDPAVIGVFTQLGCVEAVTGGFHVLSVNTLFFLDINPSSTYCANDQAPGSMVISWLSTSLENIKLGGHVAIIAGHSPPDSSWLDDCTRAYNAVVDKYNAVIALQSFASTTHKDTFLIIPRTTEAPNGGVVLSSPSLVPHYNSALRLFSYEVSGGVPRVTGYTQLYADLDRINELQYIEYQVEYNSKTDLGLGDLSVQSYLDLAERASRDKTLQEKLDLYSVVSSIDKPTIIPEDPGHSWIGGWFAIVVGVIVLISVLIGIWRCLQFRSRTAQYKLAMEDDGDPLA